MEEETKASHPANKETNGLVTRDKDAGPQQLIVQGSKSYTDELKQQSISCSATTNTTSTKNSNNNKLNDDCDIKANSVENQTYALNTSNYDNDIDQTESKATNAVTQGPREFNGIKIYDSDYYDCAVFGSDKLPSITMTESNIDDLEIMVEIYLQPQHRKIKRPCKNGSFIIQVELFDLPCSMQRNYPNLYKMVIDNKCLIWKETEYHYQPVNNHEVVSGEIPKIVRLPRYNPSNKEKLYIIVNLLRKYLMKGVWDATKPAPWRKPPPSIDEIFGDEDL